MIEQSPILAEAEASPRNTSGEVIRYDVGGWLSGPMLGSRPRPTKLGETRFWCSCDPGQSFLSACDLVRHVMEARAPEAGREGSAVVSAGQAG